MSRSRVHGGPEPWWASGDEAVDEGQDPLAAWQAARAAAEAALREDQRDGGRDAGPPPGADRSVLGDAAEALALLARVAAGRQAQRVARAQHGGAACRGCPWCTLLRAVGDARPEVVEHLGEAAHHLVLAARALVDAAEEHTAGGGWQEVVVEDDDEDDDGTAGWR